MKVRAAQALQPKRLCVADERIVDGVKRNMISFPLLDAIDHWRSQTFHPAQEEGSAFAAREDGVACAVDTDAAQATFGHRAGAFDGDE